MGLITRFRCWLLRKLGSLMFAALSEHQRYDAEERKRMVPLVDRAHSRISAERNGFPLECGDALFEHGLFPHEVRRAFEDAVRRPQ